MMFKAYDEAKHITKIFKDAFNPYQKKRILLYGLGINTKALLQDKNGINIIGVMDAKHEGEIFEGLKVFSEEEAKSSADIIVIVARVAVVPIIYGRIKYLEEYGIEIYDVSGKNLHKTKSTYRLPDYVPIQEIKSEIANHDIVCFDIFDTLIARKVVQPDDIFEIVEKRLKIRGLEFAFSKMRKRAAVIAYREKITPSLQEIYEEMFDEEKITENEIKEMMEEELEVELEYIVPRHSVISLFEYAKNLKKKVFLISDMYLNTSQIERLLKKCGIENYDRLFVSCAYKKRKWPDGELYQEVKKWSKNESILHIGDNEGADVLCAKEKGLDAIRILNIYETLVNSPFQILLSHNRTIEDSIAIGLFACRYLADPFSIGENGGILRLKNKMDLGYICYGPLVVGFLSWVRKVAESKGVSFVAFMARDGYLLEKAWKILEKRFENVYFPMAKYVLGSRRAVTIPAMRNRDDVVRALQRVPKTMKNVDMLESRFGIICTEDVEAKSKEECIQDYMELILKNAKIERREYQRYINNVMEQEGNIAIIDAVSTGTIGKYFFEATNRKGCLLCMVVSNVPDYSICDEIDVVAYMGEDSKYSPIWNIHKYVDKLEGILTAPEPMFLYFDEKGDAKYASPELSQKNREILKEVQTGIIQYVEEWSELLPDLETEKLNPKLVDVFFGLLYENNACYIENVMQSLGVSNNY